MPKISASSQDYLEAILELAKENNTIRSIDISEKLGVSRASVNRAIGVLKDAGYAIQQRYSNISLTPEGVNAALSVRDRHSTLKLFLTEILKVSDQTAEEDACKMEHSVSVETLEKLKEFMKSIKI